jgi:hypothetical protein
MDFRACMIWPFVCLGACRGSDVSVAQEHAVSPNRNEVAVSDFCVLKRGGRERQVCPHPADRRLPSAKDHEGHRRSPD